MYNTARHHETDIHLGTGSLDLGDSEVPDAPDSWALTDFDDIVPVRH
jgi:hypothetical protein